MQIYQIPLPPKGEVRLKIPLKGTEGIFTLPAALYTQEAGNMEFVFWDLEFYICPSF